MKYRGVPYHKRYHDESSEHFNSPLFLDCCGLVRRALWDMQEELGFRIGRWNQAYQVRQPHAPLLPLPPRLT